MNFIDKAEKLSSDEFEILVIRNIETIKNLIQPNTVIQLLKEGGNQNAQFILNTFSEQIKQIINYDLICGVTKFSSKDNLIDFMGIFRDDIARQITKDLIQEVTFYQGFGENQQLFFKEFRDEAKYAIKYSL